MSVVRPCFLISLGITVLSISLFLVGLHIPVNSYAQENDTRQPAMETYEGVNETDLEQTARRTRWIIWGTALSYAAYGYTNWWKANDGEFNVADELWFQEESYAGGADKLGHAYSAYVTTRLMTRGFEWAGHDRNHAANLGAIVAGSTLLGVELFDGFAQEYGFSREDLIMNILGVGMAVVLENNQKLDDLFDFRVQYRRSRDARELNERDPVSDYSGQTYLFILKASGVPALRSSKFLQYLELAVGYGSRGYEPDDGSLLDRERKIFYGLSLNVSQILDSSVFRGDRQSSRARVISRNIFEYVQIPGTAALADKGL
ncbi:MAG: YfiM family protein [Gammaproteobacteria bacterium]|nr:YfiM family protein [Gammaproteobacteria bacterium]